ncbi:MULTISPECIES: mannose-1-phosphate guanylyltransferase [unclassified Paenibacillus]|uniref:mannose-1-phosphate guanylyltransferase n=1 Tax=unclassified Paenibacillus TaxID=185978 RepID=UPI001AE85C40|nr:MULTISPECIES: mannose-1-phosphate guanylyltransferase [unclassified Paenibacillus]MBP1157475.1 mannose-1-phosphate guanylyltransferase [Paenibacillus sp. PvP091]MBP1171788.1 mannose-1-phosphate guanylyltransferase [Paenibacillus sp. PvR098]MBP2438169.1 mannose-1-phosphate guanylyltransferase [Paenibacillus sp. PvP052]
MTITAVIMAGGKGERFWPKSRTNLPKQFLNISGNKSMIQQTISRLEKLIPISQIFIVTNELYAELIKAQIPHLPVENIIIEPIGRNTAPCVGLASIIIEEKFPDSTMVVLPSDHIIENETGFIQILKTAVEVAGKDNSLVTLGISPTYPETGYGYIESSNDVTNLNDLEVHKVKKFVEKPDLATAEKYINAGNYYWNSGIFIWKVSVIREYIKSLMPEMHDILESMKIGFRQGNPKDIIQSEFHKMPDQSIDYGIMEKVASIYVIPCVFGWDDVGSWTALERINERDDNGNVIRGNILNLDTKRCIIESNGKLIATLGVEDLIIVDTEDVTLICSKEKAQEVKSLIKELRLQKLEQYL